MTSLLMIKFPNVARCFNPPLSLFTRTRLMSSCSECYRILELPENSDLEAVRAQYLRLAKRFHPDSSEGMTEKFVEIDNAYRKLVEKLENEQGSQIDEIDLQEEMDEMEGRLPDTKHASPAHRQYLSNEGFGYGSPGDRQRQYANYRALRAVDSVHRHRIDKLASKYEDRLALKEQKAVKRQTTKHGVERLVEDLIQEAMAKGEFDGLSSEGKPLPDRLIHNPYIDFTSHKLNEILVSGGFAPEWVVLKKDIDAECNRIKLFLARRFNEIHEESEFEEKNSNNDEWNRVLNGVHEDDLKRVNKMIDNYNLIVPMLSGQLFHVQLEQVVKKALKTAQEMRKEQKKIRNEQPKLDRSDFGRDDKEFNVWSFLLSHRKKQSV